MNGIYENFDSWLTGTIDFDHNETGFITHGHFIGNEDYSADISFNCDHHGNITRIHWDFSFGKYQNYAFEYETMSPK